MNDVAIKATGLTKIYLRGSEKVYALKNVDFQVRRGEILSVIGRSGSGKTTLLNLIGCLDTASEGNLIINNIDVTKMPEKDLIKIRRENIGFVFQLFYLIPTLTAFENAILPLLFTKQLGRQEKVKEIFERVELGGKFNSYPGELNSGDMQRVAIARALVNNPKIILADEPTGRLETKSKDVIFNLLRGLSKDGLAIVVATHDLSIAQKANGVVRLHDGMIVNE